MKQILLSIIMLLIIGNSYAQIDRNKQLKLKIDSLNNQKEKPDSIYYGAKTMLDSINKDNSDKVMQDSTLNLNTEKIAIETKLDKLNSKLNFIIGALILMFLFIIVFFIFVYKS